MHTCLYVRLAYKVESSEQHIMYPVNPKSRFSFICLKNQTAQPFIFMQCSMRTYLD